MGKTRSSTVAFAAAYIVFVLGLFVALGGTAYADNTPSSASDQYGTSASDQYGTKVTGIKVSVLSGATPAAKASAALPNTGLSLLGTVLLGGTFVAVGIGLRRRERRRS